MYCFARYDNYIFWSLEKKRNKQQKLGRQGLGGVDEDWSVWKSKIECSGTLWKSVESDWNEGMKKNRT